MELLAPAGNREAMVAAVQQGADAVYLGFTSFGARGYAGNFDADGLLAAVDYCHERDRRVYVTVNTLVKQREIPALYELLALINKAGADAVIVQDLGVAAIARECFPQLPLHASTQMTLHNAQGAAFARSMGIVRVVPARECPLSELEAMTRAGVEVEAFVHGALCVSVSGQCLFSSMVGGRSGNRGKCAQPCRLPYRCGEGTADYLLSMRDLMVLDRLPALAQAGVAALKIEGRMKRPEYVAVVTAAYRRALDAVSEALHGGVPYALEASEREGLMQVFHRGGFTHGHMLGDAHAGLVDPTRPNHGGLEMGYISTVRNGLAALTVGRALHDGDGLQIRDGEDREFTYAGPEVAAGERALLRTPFPVKPGSGVFRLTDAEQMRAAQTACEGENRRIPVDAVLRAISGECATLELCDGTHRVVAMAVEPTAVADRRALDEDGARKQIERMGDSPYLLRTLTVHSRDAFLPVSALNALRRDALERLAETRRARPERPALPLAPIEQCTGDDDAEAQPRLIAQTQQIEDARALLQAGAEAVYWSPADYRLSALRAAFDAPCTGPGAGEYPAVWFVLPPLAWSVELEELAAWVRGNAARFSGVVLTNPGQLVLDFGAMPRVADAPLHAWNHHARGALRRAGCVRTTLSPELNAGEIGEALTAGGGWEIAVYGRAPLMLLSHCPRRMREGAQGCARCERGEPLPPLTDRKGYVFPLARLRMEHGCQLRLLNSLPTWLLEKHNRALRMLAQKNGVSWRLCFAGEPLPQCEALVRHARACLGGAASGIQNFEGEPFSATAGHFARGVE